MFSCQRASILPLNCHCSVLSFCILTLSVFFHLCTMESIVDFFLLTLSSQIGDENVSFASVIELTTMSSPSILLSVTRLSERPSSFSILICLHLVHLFLSFCSPCSHPLSGGGGDFIIVRVYVQENACRALVTLKTRVHKHRVMAMKGKVESIYTLSHVDEFPAEITQLVGDATEKKADDSPAKGS